MKKRPFSGGSIPLSEKAIFKIGLFQQAPRLCDEVDTEIVVRIPLICGFNDDDESVRQSAEYVSSLKRIVRLDLLPFNEMAAAKYRAMGRAWKYEGASRQSDEHVARLRKIVESYGLKVNTGGLW